MRVKFLLYIASLQIVLCAEFSVLTYNIHALSPLFAGDKPRERILEILDKSYGYNCILFQENWIFSKNNLIEKIDNYTVVVSNKSKYKKLLKGILNKNGSGLTLLVQNEISIKDLSEISYDKCSGWLCKANDCIATKGFQHFTIDVDGIDVDIYNTHLDAGNSKRDQETRFLQIKQLTEYIELHSKDRPIILTGDININYLSTKEHSTLKYLVDNLGLSMVEWNNRLDAEYVLDYIFYRGTDAINISLANGGIDSNLLGTSDHPPIYAQFTLKENSK